MIPHLCLHLPTAGSRFQEIFIRGILSYWSAITLTQMYEHSPSLSQVMHDDLHCSSKGQYKLAMMIHHCLRHQAPRYLADYCAACTRVQSSRTPASAICQASLTVCCTCWLQHVSKPRLSCWRTNSVEFTDRWFAWSSCWQWTFSAGLKTHLHTGNYGVLAHQQFYIYLLTLCLGGRQAFCLLPGHNAQARTTKRPHSTQLWNIITFAKFNRALLSSIHTQWYNIPIITHGVVITCPELLRNFYFKQDNVQKNTEFV